MLRIWDTYTTKDKVLAVLCEFPFLPAEEKISKVREKMPNLSYGDVVGIFWHLDRERFVRITEDNGMIATVSVHHSARSYLRTKEENKYSLMKWDVVKLAIGFVLGFVASWLLK